MKNDTQKGSAIVWILIAVSLFAALSYAFNSSSRTSTGFITDTQAAAYASQIIAYGNEVRSAVKRMQLRGCSDTDISFENNIVTDYTNPNAPTDKSCHVFDVAGGGLTWKNPLDALGTSEWIIAEGNKVNGVGTEDPGTVDLMLALQQLPLNVCQKINDSLNHNLSVNPPTDGGTWSTTKFVGTYTATHVVGNAGQGLEGLKSACFNDDDVPQYVYYQVVLAQ